MQMKYSSNKPILKLFISWTPKNDNVVLAINAIVDDIPDELLSIASAHTGRPAYPAKLLLKMLLFGYSRQTFSGRKIADLADENIAMRWLIGDFPSTPSYRTINRFRSNDNLSILINGLFKALRDYLRMIGLLDNTALFIDGTKLLSKANKYTFVWKKSVIKSEINLNAKTDELYKNLAQENLKVPELPLGQRPLTSGELVKISKVLNSKVDGLNHLISSEKAVPGGSPNKRLRRHYKHLLHLLTSDYIPRKQRYEYDNSVFGDRNSFSKTDLDATFMRMKEDPMKNGQLKPGYNLQVASQNQFSLYYQVFQRPTDTRTLIPFMKTIFKKTPHAANYIVADAGYGSELNYQSLTDDFEVKYLIPYGMYEKEMTKKYHKDRRKVANWFYDEESDEFQDMDGIVFKFHNYSVRHNKYGDEKNLKVYQTVRYFEDPHRERLATTKSGRRRQISINNNWLFFKNLAKEQLTSKKGHSLYKLRKTEIEPVFADLKTYLNFKRFSVKGMTAVSNEIGIALMSVNLMKLIKIPRQLHLSEQKNSRKNWRPEISTIYYLGF